MPARNTGPVLPSRESAAGASATGELEEPWGNLTGLVNEHVSNHTAFPWGATLQPRLQYGLAQLTSPAGKDTAFKELQLCCWLSSSGSSAALKFDVFSGVPRPSPSCFLQAHWLVSPTTSTPEDPGKPSNDSHGYIIIAIREESDVTPSSGEAGPERTWPPEKYLRFWGWSSAFRSIRESRISPLNFGDVSSAPPKE
ncbi:hypothetical protein PG985_002915 [Apiospora marii]